MRVKSKMEKKRGGGGDSGGGRGLEYREGVQGGYLDCKSRSQFGYAGRSVKVRLLSLLHCDTCLCDVILAHGHVITMTPTCRYDKQCSNWMTL